MSGPHDKLVAEQAWDSSPSCPSYINLRSAVASAARVIAWSNTDRRTPRKVHSPTQPGRQRLRSRDTAKANWMPIREGRPSRSREALLPGWRRVGGACRTNAEPLIDSWSTFQLISSHTNSPGAAVPMWHG